MWWETKMKTHTKVYAIILLLMLCSCGVHCIDEKYAASVAKDALSIPGSVSAQVLKGGLSGASIFMVTTDSKKYIARFFEHKTKEERQQEIACLQAASEGGYGPHIYFADVDKAVVIMEYLQGQKISREQRRSEQLYAELAHLLQKIHHGPQFPTSKNVFDFLQEYLKQVKEIVKANNVEGFPLAKLEEILAILHFALAPHLSVVPCHNDIHPHNVIFLGNEFKAIDCECSAQSDPYYDIATAAIYFCFKPEYENILLTTYLERQPSAFEEAKLCLMKQVARMVSALSFLALGVKSINQYATLQVPSYWVFMKEIGMGRINLADPESQVSIAKIVINDVIAGFESKEFRDAVNLLNKNR